MSHRPTTIISTSLGAVSVPIPREGIGFVEACALSLRGWFDRSRNRAVSDATHTHSAHRLERRHRRMEAEAVRLIDSMLNRLSVRQAALEVIAGIEPEGDTQAPSASDLASLAGRDRLLWATQSREARRAHAARSATLARQSVANEELARVRMEYLGVVTEGDDICRIWEEAFMLRNARYTRARFGLGGRLPGEAPAVSGYNRAEGPHVSSVAGADRL